MKIINKIHVAMVVVEQTEDTIEELEKNNGFKLGSEEHKKFIAGMVEDVLREEARDGLKEIIVSIKGIEIEE